MSLQNFLFLKIVPEPIFLLIWHAFANVALDDYTNAYKWHLCGISIFLKYFINHLIKTKIV